MRTDKGEATNVICLDIKMSFDTGTLKTRYRVSKQDKVTDRMSLKYLRPNPVDITQQNMRVDVQK